jgi:DNA transposition AAA+ family ATPase
MSTRQKTEAGALSHSRYMSSREFGELRGVNGVSVSARAAILVGSRKQNFIWWLQGLSLAEGGLKRVARELLEMFPERIGMEKMHSEGIKPEKNYSAEMVESVRWPLDYRDGYGRKKLAPRNGGGLVELCRDFALRQHDYSQAACGYDGQRAFPSLEEFLIDLCLNPRVHFSPPEEKTDFSSLEASNAIEEFPELSRDDFAPATVPYFQDVIGALFEYQASQEAQGRAAFCRTEIGKKIWDTLDFALARRRMVVLDGLEGRGKTEAVKAWCALHLGTARFVSLKGVTNKTTAFRDMAKALGIASSYTRTAPEMQARIEDVLKRSKLMLVLDEAHFLFNQSQRMYTRPELVDWIDTAICNQGVGIALVTTPQFIACMTRAADQVEWNYRQFRRRVARWTTLPAQNTEADIKAVARSVFKNADTQMVSKIVGYALLSKRDLSAVGDVADEVRAMLGTDDLSKTTIRHIDRAIHEFLLPSDDTFLKGMAAVRNTGRKPGRKIALNVPAKLEPDNSQDEESQPASAPATRSIRPADEIGSDLPRRAGGVLELAKG